MKTKPAKKPTSATVTSGIVLCGTDFSSAADVAVDIARDFSRRLGVPLFLLHAVEMPRVLAGDAKVTRWLMASRKRSLRAVAAGSRKRGVEVVKSVRAGNADELLVDTARTEKAQMIVVSSEGERGPGKWFLGRVAERTAENAETPVLGCAPGCMGNACSEFSSPTISPRLPTSRFAGPRNWPASVRVNYPGLR